MSNEKIEKGEWLSLLCLVLFLVFMWRVSYLPEIVVKISSLFN